MRQTEYDRILEYARSAMRTLKGAKVPPYPQFYELWYTYFAGINERLNEALTAVLNEGGQTPDQLMALYREFIEPSDRDERLTAVSDQMASTIGEVNNAMGEALTSTKAYSGCLKDASRQLDTEMGANDLKSLASSLLVETENVQGANLILEERLVESSQSIDALRRELEMARRESQQDALTGIANRKCFDERLLREIEIAGRDNTPLTLVMMDIDHFKRFNDTYGHLTGDQVLKLVASTIKASARSTDLAARYGGEEFTIIVPACSLDAATQIADKVRLAVQAKELLKRSTNEKLGRITISGGVAQWRTGDSMAQFIERADTALYLAKNNGRNRIETANNLPSSAAA